jgi:hypothetical protein
MYVCYTWSTHTDTDTQRERETHICAQVPYVCYVNIANPVGISRALYMHVYCVHVTYTLRTPPNTGASGTALNEETVRGRGGGGGGEEEEEEDLFVWLFKAKQGTRCMCLRRIRDAPKPPVFHHEILRNCIKNSS